MEWATNLFDQAGFQPIAIPLAFLLGLIGAVASACCTLPVMGAIVGYSGARKDVDRRTTWISALSFMLGTIVALIIIGSVAGFVGQVAESELGKYWKIFAGFAAILLGLVTLRLLPFRFTRKTPKDKEPPKNLLGVAVFGLVLGGGVSVASIGCNPAIFIVLGAAVLQGHVLWAMAILTSYAIGFSLPLTAILLGVSFGKSAIKAKKAELVMRIAGGILLLIAGFYFLLTF